LAALCNKFGGVAMFDVCSGTTDCGYSRDVRFSPNSDQIAAPR
jgi:hypothetical protein